MSSPARGESATAMPTRSAVPDTAAAPSIQASGRDAVPLRQRTTSTTTQSSWNTANDGTATTSHAVETTAGAVSCSGWSESTPEAA